MVITRKLFNEIKTLCESTLMELYEIKIEDTKLSICFFTDSLENVWIVDNDIFGPPGLEEKYIEELKNIQHILQTKKYI